MDLQPDLSDYKPVSVEVFRQALESFDYRRDAYSDFDRFQVTSTRLSLPLGYQSRDGQYFVHGDLIPAKSPIVT